MFLQDFLGQVQIVDRTGARSASYMINGFAEAGSLTQFGIAVNDGVEHTFLEMLFLPHPPPGC